MGSTLQRFCLNVVVAVSCFSAGLWSMGAVLGTHQNAVPQQAPVIAAAPVYHPASQDDEMQKMAARLNEIEPGSKSAF